MVLNISSMYKTIDSVLVPSHEPQGKPYCPHPSIPSKYVSCYMIHRTLNSLHSMGVWIKYIVCMLKLRTVDQLHWKLKQPSQNVVEFWVLFWKIDWDKLAVELPPFCWRQPLIIYLSTHVSPVARTNWTLRYSFHNQIKSDLHIGVFSKTLCESIPVWLHCTWLTWNIDKLI